MVATETGTQTLTLTLSTETIRALRLEALMESRTVDQIIEALAVPVWRQWVGDRPAPKPRRAKQPVTDFELELAARYPCRKCQAEGR
jgi:hypothetical protein